MTLHNMFGALALDDTLTDGTQKSQIVDAGGVAVDVTPANALKVDNSGVTQPVSGTVSISGTVPVSGPLTDTQLRASAVGVSVASLPLPAGAATAAKQPSLGTAGSPSADVITVQGSVGMEALKVDASATVQPITGNVAHDAADSGAPLKVGAKASTGLHSVTPVANNDRTDMYAGSDGVLIVREHSNLESTQSGVTTLSSITDTPMSNFSAPGAGVRWYITDIIVHNSSSYGTSIRVKNGTGGTVQAILPAPARGGMVHRFAVPLKMDVNTGVVLELVTLADPVHVTICGFKSKI